MPSNRRVFKISLLLALLIAGVWAAVVIDVLITGTREGAAPADAIAVLGAAQYNGKPSPVFKARLEKAAWLYRSGKAPVILVTGGIGNRDTVSEAEVGRRYLTRLGLPGDSVIALPASATTVSSVAQLGTWFKDRPSKRVVLVSDGFHLLRLRILADRQGLVPFTSPTKASPISASLHTNAGYVAAEGWKVPVAWLFYR
ncbi:MAG TPA: YdcF family protein [Gemmatimonadales bacterium]|nr:YdcF family protein [Gemmatimonadales bacterium]